MNAPMISMMAARMAARMAPRMDVYLFAKTIEVMVETRNSKKLGSKVELMIDEMAAKSVFEWVDSWVGLEVDPMAVGSAEETVDH